MYTTQNQPLPWVQPYMQDYLGRAQEVSNQGYTQSPTQTAQPNDLLTGGWQAIANRAMGGSPVMSAGNQTLMDTLSGKFVGQQNPYLDTQISNAQGDLAKSWNTVAKPSWETSALKSGSFGNSAIGELAGNAQGNLANAMGRIGSDMRSNAYNTERGFQQQALGMAPQYAAQDYYDANQLLTAGTQAQGYADRNAGQNYAWWQEAQQFPQQKLDVMGKALGGMNFGSQHSQPGVSGASSTLGGALVGSQLGNSLGIGADWGTVLGGLFGYFGRP